MLEGLQEAWRDITPPAKKSLLIENPLTDLYYALESSEEPLSDWLNSISQRCQKPARGALYSIINWLQDAVIGTTTISS